MQASASHRGVPKSPALASRFGDSRELGDAAVGLDEVSERGVLTAPEQLWATAVRQAAVISRLAELDVAGVTAVDAAAAELRLSRRQVYVLLGR